MDKEFEYRRVKPHRVKGITYNSNKNNTYDPEPVTYGEHELTKKQKEEYEKIKEAVNELKQHMNESDEEYERRIAIKEFSEHEKKQIISDLENIAAENDAELQELKDRIKELKQKIGTRSVTKKISNLLNLVKGGRSKKNKKTTTRRRRRRSVRRFHSRRTSMRRRSK